MDRGHLTTGLVLLLVVLAGCSGPGGNGGETATAAPTATPASTPASTPTATQSAESYPDGWSASGVEDAQAARDSHYRAVLAGPSTTVEYQSRVLESANDTGHDTTLEMALDTQNRRLYADIEGADAHRQVFFADGRLSRWDVANETVVSESETQFHLVAQSVDRGVLVSHLLLYELEENGTVRRSGVTARRYEVTGVHRNTLSNAYGSATAADGHLVVGPSGRLIELETTVTFSRARVRYHYQHSNFGQTTVQTPDWRAA
ncbi:hypothetical protein SAMN04488065_1717 [Haloplanus vescus]|uniref:Uncharacterized protein n=1 Tax=Haloplanus vescus TaxID=555874 RepID=A0A1H3Y7S0_9EURY|nr:hypothetical protein [Haloplanus vescus]SEA07737.1 hypothetical protein SAMN04488065_1717 [Haloplanus vescus]